MGLEQLDTTESDIPALPRGQYAGQQLAVRGGNILPSSVQELLDYAQMMAKGGLALPAHFRGQPGVCLAIIKKAMRWEMDEWEVANSTYSVNNRLAYEAGLIAAVVKKWAPVKEKVWAPIYEGEGPTRKCTITVHHRETGEVISYTSPIVGKTLGPGVKEPPTDYVGIWPKNSPLWRFDPDQQLYYYTIRALARRFFPDILRGVYDREEVLTMRDITPKAGTPNFLEEGVDDLSGMDGEVQLPQRAALASSSEAAMPMAPTKEPDRVPIEIEEAPEDPPAPTIVPPDIIQRNLIASIRGQTDTVRLENWQRENHGNINSLPPALQAEVRKALSDQFVELEPL